MASGSGQRHRPSTECGLDGAEKMVLRRGKSCSAEVYLHGAQISSWKVNRQQEMLVTSKTTLPKALIQAGGIQVCFPNFEGVGSLGNKGFARSRLWSVDTDPPPPPRNHAINSYTDLILKPSHTDFKIWPHSFEFRLRISLGPGGELRLTSRIRNVNTNGKPFTFKVAHPAYLYVPDVSDVCLEKLETQEYLDNLQNREKFCDPDVVTFEEEVDRVYLSAPNKIVVIKHQACSSVVILKDGLPDVAVWSPWEDKESWNPFIKKAKAKADFEDADYKHILCVGAAAVGEPITLKPGQEWKGWQEMSVASSSYHSPELDPSKTYSSQ